MRLAETLTQEQLVGVALRVANRWLGGRLAHVWNRWAADDAQRARARYYAEQAIRFATADGVDVADVVGAA